jgi:hypothetical protein
MKIADYGKAITSYIESPTTEQKKKVKLRASLMDEYLGDQLDYQKAVDEGFQGTEEEYRRYKSTSEEDRTFLAEGTPFDFSGLSVPQLKLLYKRYTGTDGPSDPKQLISELKRLIKGLDEDGIPFSTGGRVHLADGSEDIVEPPKSMQIDTTTKGPDLFTLQDFKNKAEIYVLALHNRALPLDNIKSALNKFTKQGLNDDTFTVDEAIKVVQNLKFEVEDRAQKQRLRDNIIAGTGTVKREDFKRGKLAVSDPALQATVKKLFEDGLSNSQVAEKIGKSINTVKRIKKIVGAEGQKEALMKSQAAKYTKLKEVIEKANDGLKFVEMQELRNLVNLPVKSVVSDLKNYEKFNIPKLDKASDKVKKAFLSIVENADTPVEEVFDITSNIGNRTNLSVTSVSKFLNQLPEYKEFKPIASKLQRAAFKASVANKGLTLNDVIDMADAPKFKTVAVTNTPENFIIESAKRHVNQGGNKIEFLKMPGTLDKNGNLLSNTDAEFTYKGKTYTYDDLRIKGSKLPVFKEVYKKFENLENLLSKEVIHPVTKEKINFRTLMSEAYNKGAGYSYAKSPYEIDHFKTVKDSPFNDLRILPRRINMVQGMITEKGKQAELGFLKGAAEDYSPEKVKAYIKKSGYDFTKDIDKLATDEIKLADDILVKNRKLRSPVQIGKEIFKNVGKKTLKALPVIGTAIGISDVAQALEKGVTSPIDLFAAYQISPEAALESKKYREDPEFRKKSRAETFSIPLDEGTYDAIDEQTSPFGKYNDQIKNIKLP